MNNEFDERIIRYYDAEMTEDESKAFELELVENLNLKQEFEFYGSMIEGIRSEGAIELKDYIKAHIKTEEIEEQSNLWMYAAASITFLLFSYFAIYSYLETGNIKDAAEIITLKDKKSNKFKFWKKDKTIVNSEYNDSTRAYKDSLLSLENSRKTDTSLDNAIAMNEPISEANDDISLTPGAEIESTKDMLPSESSIFDQEEAIALTQVVLIPIKLKEIEQSPIPASAQSINPGLTRMKELTTAKKSNQKTQIDEVVQLEKINRTDSQESKPKPRVSQRFTKFKLQNFEDEKGIIKIATSRSKNPTVLEISLFNIWGVNPLVFEINDSYYLDLGPNGPWIEKGGSGIWKIPMETGVFVKIDWVKNKQIIDQIRN